MSGKIMGGAFGRDLRPLELLVLLAYCDHADDDGENIYPSAGLVAWKTRLSVREIRKLTKRLVERRLLVPVSANHGGYRKTNQYRANLDAVPLVPRERGEQRSPFACEKGEQHNTEGVNSATEGVNSTTARGEQPFTQTVKESSSESSRSNRHHDDDVATAPGDVTDILRAYRATVGRALTEAQAIELRGRYEALASAGHAEFFGLALQQAVNAEHNPFTYLRAILDECIKTGRPPGSNGKNGSGQRTKHAAPDTPEARRNYYVPPGYEDLVEY